MFRRPIRALLYTSLLVMQAPGSSPQEPKTINDLCEIYEPRVIGTLETSNKTFGLACACDDTFVHGLVIDVTVDGDNLIHYEARSSIIDGQKSLVLGPLMETIDLGVIDTVLSSCAQSYLDSFREEKGTPDPYLIASVTEVVQ